MKFPSYPKYKDSGVEWLGEVPEHWEVKRSDGIVATEHTQISPAAFFDQEVFHYSIPVVQEIGTGALEEGESIASAKQIISNPVVLVSKLNPRKATVCIARPYKQLTLCSGEFVVLHAEKCAIKYLFYLCLNELFRQRLDSMVQSVTRSHQRANPQDVYRFWHAWPSLPEQHAIAAFLDAQTAKIDTLIAKKRELIDKLKEKRAALITRTVTRGLPPEAAKAAGLDPNPRMKDSGVEWLGEVPEHWEVNKFGRHIRWIEQGWSPQADAGAIEEGSWGVLKLSSVKAGSFNPDECKGLPDDVQAPPDLEVKVGDLLITRANTPDLVGDACVVDRTPALRMLCDLIYRVHVDHKRIVTYFAKYFLISKSGRSQIIMDARGTSGSMVKIAQGHIKGWSIPVPPLKEQRAISGYLDRETTKLDALTAKVESAIERLQEYRSALITAAVTGKIDVREATQ